MSDAMAPTAGSSEMKRALAKSVLLASDRKLEEGLITDAHRVATFLNPRLRHLRHLTEEEKKKVIKKPMCVAWPLNSGARQSPKRDAPVGTAGHSA